MPIGKGIEAAGNTVSQVMKAQGAKKAASAQERAINNAGDKTNEAYGLSQGFQQPYQDAGRQTIGQLASGLQDGGEFNRNFSAADFKADPGYQFRMDQGQQAVERSAAARGGVLSGAALKGAQQYGQGLASQEYQSAYTRYNNDLNSRFNRLSSVAQMGQSAANVGSGLATKRGDTLADYDINRGNVRAGKQIALANANASSNQGAANFVASLYGGGSSYGK